jgi:ribonucleoside-diphosphate reductase alpha chain
MKHDQVDTPIDSEMNQSRTPSEAPDAKPAFDIDEDGAVAVDKPAAKQPRADVLTGVTQRVQTGYGQLYVTINEDATGQPFELFANIGSSGGFTASFTEALAKTVSTALRAGVAPEELASELRGIRSPKVGWDKGDKTQSIPDAIGLVMTRYLEDDLDLDYPQQQNLVEAIGEESAQAHKVDGGTVTEQSNPNMDVGATEDGGEDKDDEKEDATAALIAAGESPECGECGSMALYFSEGCVHCEACGYSECS